MIFIRVVEGWKASTGMVHVYASSYKEALNKLIQILGK